MKRKVFLISLCLLLTLLVVSCTPKPQSTPTNTPEVVNESDCHPSTERIEMNTSLSGGVGPSYSYPEVCSVYCLWVPDGTQLKIGISDLFSDLSMYVAQDLFTRWDASGSGTQDKSVSIADPSGRYYIWVCPPDSSVSYTKVGATMIETSDAQFTLSSEFTP